MKKLIRIFTGSLALLLLLCSVVTCGKKNVLIVGTSPDFLPYEYLDETGNIIGFDIELMLEIGKRIGKRIEFRAMGFNEILEAVKNREIDAGLSAFTITTQRMQEVLFSMPYTTNAQVLVVKSDDFSWYDMYKEQIEEKLKNSIRIGACENYVGYFYAESMILQHESSLQGYPNFTQAISALNEDEIDVIIMDRVVAQKAANLPENNIKVISETLTTENFGIPIAFSNLRLKEQIDKALQDMIEDGFIEALTVKWKQ